MEDRYHLIGIGGAGMSGLARILLQKGCKVSGSDLVKSSVTQDLEKEGATIYIGHRAEQVPQGAFVVYSSAAAKGNVEYDEAFASSKSLLHRSELLQKLMAESKALLVAGTHGKTTTSSFLAHVLVFAGLDPSYSIGGFVRNLGFYAGHGKGQWFVAEADESDGSFLNYTPEGAIITNVDLDHLDYWATEEKLKQGFREFEGKIRNKELLFWCADDVRLSSLGFPGTSYGFSDQADLQIQDVRYFEWNSYFSVFWKGRLYQEVEIPLVGRHNVLNGAAVFGMALNLGVAENTLRLAMRGFLGAKRRLEKKGEEAGILVYDDYGHHPTEVRATLAAVKVAVSPRRLVVLFQPHRYTRTRDCFIEFGPALSIADLIVLTDVYAAQEEPIEGISGLSLFDQIVSQGFSHVRYIPREELVLGACSLLQEGDVVVSMGAGDITVIGPELLKRLKNERVS